MIPSELFLVLGGANTCLPSPVQQGESGVVYRRSAGVSLLTQPCVGDLSRTLRDFFAAYAPMLGYDEYLVDPTPLHGGAQAVKFAGQLCYMSFGPARTRNSEAGTYIRHLLESGHGSCLEHAHYGLLLYGLSRACSHELVRHRHFAFSQQSQRYVGLPSVVFVEHPAFQQDALLHAAFLQRTEDMRRAYEVAYNQLAYLQDAGAANVQGETKRDQRKIVRQAARMTLNNEVEAPIYVTGSVRTWRQFLEARCTRAADMEIRNLALRVYLVLHEAAPFFFDDYVVEDVPDGTWILYTPYTKV